MSKFWSVELTLDMILNNPTNLANFTSDPMVILIILFPLKA